MLPIEQTSEASGALGLRYGELLYNPDFIANYSNSQKQYIILTTGVEYVQEMSKMLHNEARELLLKAWDKTHNVQEVAECFSVNKSTVYRLVERRDRTGEWKTRTHLRGRNSALWQEQK